MHADQSRRTSGAFSKMAKTRKGGRGRKGKSLAVKPNPTTEDNESVSGDAVEVDTQTAEEEIPADEEEEATVVEKGPTSSDAESTPATPTEDRPQEIQRKRGRGVQTLVWTQRMLERLVDLWEEHEFLYDKAHDNYHNTALKKKALEAMGCALDISGIYNFVSWVI